MQSIVFSLKTVGPVFLIIAFGILLRIFRLVDRSMASQLSRLVFHVFLPALLIRNLAEVDFPALFSMRLVAAAWGTFLTTYAVSWFGLRSVGVDRETRAILVSGATWSNLAIVGFALGEALYGAEGLARAAILSALLLPIHTTIGTVMLDQRSSSDTAAAGKLRSIGGRLVRNPIIIAVVLGVSLSFLPSGLPLFVGDMLGILGRASLPLALVAIGASLDFTRDSAGWWEPIGGAGIKLIVMPLVAYLAGSLLKLGPAWTGSLTIAFACPTAISFFVISRNLGYDASRGAAIVTATTVGAALTAGTVAVIMKIIGLA